jgi:DNA-binding response OmpR family regulator
MSEDIPRIVMVDDEPESRRLIAAALNKRYEVFAVPEGLHLQEILEDLEPSLLILDVQLPVFTGVQLCQMLRARRKFDSLPVLFLSALTQEDDIAAGIRAGGDFYLGKPFDVFDLRRTVEALIGRKHGFPNDDR